MNNIWHKIAHRIVQGLGVQPGESILILDDSSHLDLKLKTALAIRRVGARVYGQSTPAGYLQRLWDEAPQSYLAKWDQYQLRQSEQIDRVLVLGGTRPAVSYAPMDTFDACQQAAHDLAPVAEAQHLPFLLVAIPTVPVAEQLGIPLATLESIMLPAMDASADELQQEIDQFLAKVQGGGILTIRSGDGYELRLEQGGRPWIGNDGTIGAADQRPRGIVATMPAGSVYTTVLEDKTEGTLWLSKAGDATDVLLTFSAGKIDKIEAASGAEALAAALDTHIGEPRRVSHIGLGLNPYLTRAIGWRLVDEHAHGQMSIGLGENRHMRGQNASSLNVGYAITDATLFVDDQIIV